MGYKGNIVGEVPSPTYNFCRLRTYETEMITMSSITDCEKI